MENNNGWYNGTNQYSSQNSDSEQHGGYSGMYQPPVKKKKTVSLAAVIALVLVAALIGIGAGAGVFYLSYAVDGREALNESAQQSVDIVTPPALNDDASTPADSEPNAGNDPQASQELTMGVANTADNSSANSALQASMATIVGIETVGGSGSGVIVTANGYIVTNYHVISEGSTITVYLQDGTEYEAKLIGKDSYTDLAVIKVEAENLPAAVLGDSTSVSVGDNVFAIGNPLGVLACSVSRGIVSGLDRTIQIDGVSMTLMQTDAAVNPGNSGGGLFSAEGVLIGIINAKSTGVDVEGLGFAIPIDSAKPIIADLMDYGFVTGRPYLGITMQNISMTDNSADSNSNGFGYGFGNYMFGGYITRVMVTSVEQGSAAAEAGLQVNDIILKLDGEDVQGYTQLSVMLYEYQPGDVVTLTIQRGNGSMELQLTLGSKTAA